MTMDGLLSLRWNNHSTSFLKQLSFLHEKDRYSDLTLVCGGQFYRVHQLVVSCCSEYFRTILENTPCRHPAIVLQDLLPRHLEALLSYMYLGQVSVTQDDLGALIKAAECLAIKGLTVPDEAHTSKDETHTRRDHTKDEDLQHPKRLRQDRVCSSPSLPAPMQRNESMVENDSSKMGSRGTSPQSITVPSQQQNFLERTVIKLEDEEDEVKCEGGTNLEVPDPCVSLPCHEEDMQTKNQNTFKLSLPDTGSDGSGAGLISPHFLTHPQSFEEVISQALPGTSGIERDTGQIWDGSQGSEEVAQSFPLDTFTSQEIHHSVHHTASLHHTESPMGSILQGSRQHQDTSIAPQPTAVPYPVPQLQGKKEARCGRPWKKWQCVYPDCGYTTDRESWLRQHIRKHTGEKPFACPMCEFRSAQKGNVIVHLSRVHHVGVPGTASLDSVVRRKEAYEHV